MGSRPVASPACRSTSLQRRCARRRWPRSLSHLWSASFSPGPVADRTDGQVSFPDGMCFPVWHSLNRVGLAVVDRLRAHPDTNRRCAWTRDCLVESALPPPLVRDDLRNVEPGGPFSLV